MSTLDSSAIAPAASADVGDALDADGDDGSGAGGRIGDRSASPTRASWHRWAMPAALAATGIAGIAYVALVDPTTGAYPPCPWRAATGIDCPGCGSIRALHALLGGDIVRAADHNLLLVLAIPVAILAAVVAVARRATGHPPLTSLNPGPGMRLAAPLAVAAAVTTFWLLRVAGPESLRWLGSGT